MNKAKVQVPRLPRCLWCHEQLKDKAYEYMENHFCGKGCAFEYGRKNQWLHVTHDHVQVERGRLPQKAQLALALLRLRQQPLALFGTLSYPCSE